MKPIETEQTRGINKFAKIIEEKDKEIKELKTELETNGTVFNKIRKTARKETLDKVEKIIKERFRYMKQQSKILIDKYFFEGNCKCLLEEIRGLKS